MQGPAESLPYLEEALALFTEMHETMLAAETLSSIGSAYIDLGDDARAAEYLARAQRVAEGTVAAGSTPAMILQRMGRLRERAGDPAAALDCYLRSLDILQELGMPEEQAEVHERLAALYPTLNDYRSAYEHQRRVMALREELAGAERHRAAAAVELRHARLSAERERELLRLRAEDAERQAERQANELGEMLMRLTQRNEAFRSLRELAAPYARDGRGQTKALATSVLRDIAAAVDIDHAWPLFERAHNDFIETLRRRSQRLSAAEIRICVMIRSNLSTKQIADVLFVSDLTVKKHRANIRKKLGLHGDGYLNEWLLTL
jgi:DNA-binding CsgD family transcriptional regulator